MKNIAIIFAGGIGSRMKTDDLPKQFLKVRNKEIIVYTLEVFENNDNIDVIILVCVSEWLEYARKLTKKFSLKKVEFIVPGGETGQLSIYEGLKCAHDNYGGNNIVLIHDGVRPLIFDSLINNNISMVTEYGNCISITPAIETVVELGDSGEIQSITNRHDCYHAKAPQSFILDEIYELHLQSMLVNDIDNVDSATLMIKYGHKLYTTASNYENIKITTPIDYQMFKAIIESDVHQERVK